MTVEQHWCSKRSSHYHPSRFRKTTGNDAKFALQWRHNGRDIVSNHQPHDCLLNRLFRRKENIKAPLHWPLCGTGEFPTQMASYAENVSIWWRHHGLNTSIIDSHVKYSNICKIAENVARVSFYFVGQLITVQLVCRFVFRWCDHRYI